MNYKQLSAQERHTIEKLLKLKLSFSNIAKVMNRSKSTISREIKRNSNNGVYCFDKAENNFIQRSKHKYYFKQLNFIKFSLEFVKRYNKKVNGVESTWSFIKNNFKFKIPSLRQVFNWIKSNRWVIKMKQRLRSWYKKGGKRTKGIFSKFNNKRVMPIWVRPKNIDLRKAFGHWEIDLIIGRKANGYANLLTFTERKTRLHLIKKVFSKNPMKINSEIYKLIKKHNLLVKTITCDNGLEFDKIGLLAHWINCKVYYCEPYASFQRGTNEHANGIVRRFFPKKTDFTPITESEIDAVSDQINNMPRKMFNWKSSFQMYRAETIK